MYKSSKNNPYIFNNKELVKVIEYSIENDGTSFICTFVASAIKMLEGDNIKNYGFSSDNNPEAKYFLGDGEDGHHFSIMNDRYIIDPWIYNNYEDYTTNKIFGRSVFDLHNKNDKKIIKYLYGDPNKWVNITSNIKHFEHLFAKTHNNLLRYYKNLINL